MQRLSLPEAKDSRIAIVGITEEDIQSANRYPYSDLDLAGILQKIESYRPALIGLDLIRDVPVPPNSHKLGEIFQSERLVAAGTIGVGNPAIAFPPAARHRGDVTGIEDFDGMVRRSFLYPGSEPVENFALALASRYLEKQGIDATAGAGGWLQLKDTHFTPLRRQAGGYAANSDMGGYQIPIRWRNHSAPFPMISVGELFSGRVEPAALENRIVLLGSIAPSMKDGFRTPFRPPPQQLYGVEIHAHVLSQILSAVLDGRPLLKAAPFSTQVVFVLLSAAGALALLAFPKRRLSPSRIFIRNGVIALSYLLLLNLIGFFSFIFLHYWLPLAAVSLLVAIYAFIYSIIGSYFSHLEILECEIERVSSELNEANRLILHESLENAANKMAVALVREISPTIRRLIHNIDISRLSDHNSEIAHSLNAMEGEIGRLKNLIYYILPDLSRQHDKKYKVGDYKLWLEGLLRNTIDHQLQASRLLTCVKTSVICCPELEKTPASLPLSLHSILFALLENALEACLRQFDIDASQQYFVEILSKIDGKWLEISVRDNGAPLPVEIASSLFAPFASQKSSGGFGLGLYRSQRLAVQMGGSISYEFRENIKIFSTRIPIVD